MKLNSKTEISAQVNLTLAKRQVEYINEFNMTAVDGRSLLIKKYFYVQFCDLYAQEVRLGLNSDFPFCNLLASCSDIYRRSMQNAFDSDLKYELTWDTTLKASREYQPFLKSLKVPAYGNQLFWLLEQPFDEEVVDGVLSLAPFGYSAFHDVLHWHVYRLITPNKELLDASARDYFLLVEAIVGVFEIVHALQLGSRISYPLHQLKIVNNYIPNHEPQNLRLSQEKFIVWVRARLLSLMGRSKAEIQKQSGISQKESIFDALLYQAWFLNLTQNHWLKTSRMKVKANPMGLTGDFGLSACLNDDNLLASIYQRLLGKLI